MIAWLRRAWLWIVAGLGSALALVVLLWRSAVRGRDKALTQRDAAQASAHRGETVVGVPLIEQRVRALRGRSSRSGQSGDA